MMNVILMRDNKELIAHPLTSESITIGRAQDNTLQLTDPTISRTHCRIDHEDGITTLTDLSRNGIILNGSPVSRTELSDGDIVTMGPWQAKIARRDDAMEMTVVDHHEPTRVLSFDAAAKTITEDTLHLTAVSPDQQPLRKRISRDTVTLGTLATCDVPIADSYVSRQHCKLIVKGNSLVLIDLGSTNGTFVEGVRVDKTALAAEGSFTIGKTTVRYRRERSAERIRPSRETALGSMLGKSSAIREIFSVIKRAAPSDVTVCVQGESGTGKELAAREIHNLSGRHAKDFVALNCGAIPPTIIESMLFGHERGAFTGAVERQAGVFEQAHGGTLFLDEIGEMDINLQTRLLRVIEDRTVRRLGSREDICIDVRLIVATHQDLKKLVGTGHFREDLFYRLYVLPLCLPPLRGRRKDIPLLAKHFVESFAPEGRCMTLSRAAMTKLVEHDWPGNVRELKNTLTRAMIMVQADVIDAPNIQLISSPRTSDRHTAMDNHERDAIIDALRKTKGNQSRAADILGIARTTISYKIGRYGIKAKHL